jgi:hypothetical protein
MQVFEVRRSDYGVGLLEVNPEWPIVAYLPAGIQSSPSLLVQLGILGFAVRSTAADRRLTPWVFLAVPVALLPLANFILAIEALNYSGLDRLTDFPLGFWGAMIAGLGSLTLVIGLVVAGKRIWVRATSTQLIFALGALAALAAAVAFFVSLGAVESAFRAGEEFGWGGRWDSFTPWWTAASLVILGQVVAYPVAASVFANRVIGAPLAFGAALALLLFYASSFLGLLVDQDLAYRATAGVLAPMLAILITSGLAAAIWKHASATDGNDSTKLETLAIGE